MALQDVQERVKDIEDLLNDYGIFKVVPEQVIPAPAPAPTPNTESEIE